MNYLDDTQSCGSDGIGEVTTLKIKTFVVIIFLLCK
jgi:hypothetical protein